MNVRNGLGLFLFFLMSVSLLAQGKPELQITIQDEKVNLSAAERKGTAEIMHQPGDTIRYLVTAANIGTGAMTEAVVVAPIPDGTTYVPGSTRAQAAEEKFSIDQGKTYMAWPPTYWTNDSKGKKVLKEASPEMITDIQWRIKQMIQPGEIVDLEYQVKVNQ